MITDLENENTVLGTDHDHNVGTPSSFGRTGSKKKNQNSIEICLFGKKKKYPLDDDDSNNDNHPSATSDHDNMNGVGIGLNTNHTIDLLNLRRLASQGIPDNGCYRAIVWRVLLGHLPCSVKDWDEVLQKERNSYNALVEELFNTVIENHDIKNYYESYADTEETQACNKIDETEEIEKNDDDDEGSENVSEPLPTDKDEKPLDKNNNSPDNELTKTTNENDATDATKRINNMELNEPFNENATLEQESTPVETNLHEINTEDETTTNNNATTISDTDEGRTIKYISSCDGTYSEEEELDENVVLLEEIRKDVVRTHPSFHFFLEPEENLGQQRYEAIERILFVWAKLNKGVRYVQGMNEIAGTIYFVLANDSNEEWAKEAEADAYFLFNTLMSDMRDVYVPDLDDADTGIQGRISNFVTLLGLHDPEVKCHLDDIGIDATFFCIRWLTTLLSREFMLPDTIRIWDSMFASTHKDNFLRYVCVTMVMVIRNKLLHSDFSQCLRLLQSYPPTNIDRLLESSRALWIYESQVTLACYKGGIRLQHALKSLVPPPAIIMAYGLNGGVAQPKSSSSSYSQILPNARKSARAYLNSSSKNSNADNENSSSDNTTSKEGFVSSKKKFFGGGAKNFFSQMSNYISETNSLIDKVSDQQNIDQSN